MMTDASVSLESLIGKPRNVFDPFYGSGGQVKWLSTYKNPERLCMLIHKESQNGLMGLPSEELVWGAGGFWAHLQVTEYDSGLFVGEVHADLKGMPHTPVAYPTKSDQITECRGITKDNKPEYGLPAAVQGLSRNRVTFEMAVEELPIKGVLGTVTRGVKGVAVQEVNVELSYAVATQITLKDKNSHAPVVSELGAEVNLAGKTMFGLNFTLAGLSPLSYIGALWLPSQTRVCFDAVGDVSEVSSVGKEGNNVLHPKGRWGLIFSVAFNAAERIPSIDILSTMKRIAAGDYQLTRPSADSFLVYKQ